MIRIRSCEFVIAAVLLTLLNTFMILVYLGPLGKFKADTVGLPVHPRTSGNQPGEATEVGRQVSSLHDLSQISVINQLGYKDGAQNKQQYNGTNVVDVITSWPMKLHLNKPEHNLNHARDKLKFNAAAMRIVGHSPVKPVDIVIGIPTVMRESTDYLSATLHQLVRNLNENETTQCHIIVFSANFEDKANQATADFIKNEFATHVESGLIQVIKPDFSFYPKLKELPLLWKDKEDRVKWRAKQCIDYALMFLYSQSLGKYYLQLEDDITVSKTYFRDMKSFIAFHASKSWSNLQFGPGGFIGMLYKTADLGRLALFVKMYYWVFPVDILFRHFNDIHLSGNTPLDVFHPPLFQHVGKQSSLKGQVRKIDSDLREILKPQSNVRLYMDANNPNAIISTTIQVFESNTIDKPYRAKDIGYFWGKNIQTNDYVMLELLNEVQLARVVIDSGSKFAPNDFLVGAKLEVANAGQSGSCNEQDYKLLNDTVIHGKIDSGVLQSVGYLVKCVKMTVTKLNVDEKNHSRWLLIREIAIWTK